MIFLEGQYDKFSETFEEAPLDSLCQPDISRKLPLNVHPEKSFILQNQGDILSLRRAQAPFLWTKKLFSYNRPK